MMNDCQQRRSAFQESQESLTRSTRDVGNFLSSIVNQERHKEEQLRDQVSGLTKDVDDSVKKIEQESMSHCNVIGNFNAELESLSGRKATQSKMISLLQEELDHLAREHSNVKVPDKDIMESKVKRLKAEDGMFRQQLGVEINKIKGGFLQIVFSNVNFNKPDSLYMFSMKLDEDRKYIVTDCKPPVQDIDAIVMQLNADNDFNKFMHTVRRRFKEGAHSES